MSLESGLPPNDLHYSLGVQNCIMEKEIWWKSLNEENIIINKNLYFTRRLTGNFGSNKHIFATRFIFFNATGTKSPGFKADFGFD